MKLSAILAPMIAANVPGDVILATVRAYEDQAEELSEGSKEKARARWRRWKNKQGTNVGQRLQTDANGGKPLTRGEDNLLTKNQAEQKNKNSLDANASVSALFEDFWIVFPKREGSNPKKPARERFLRLVAKGRDPHKLIDAALEFAKEHPSPTRFVPQAVTWLNQERFDTDEPVRVADIFCPEGQDETRLHVLRYRNEHNGHDPPRGVQAGRAGYMIPAGWVRAMELRRQANG
jgi:hypothetical protein